MPISFIDGYFFYRSSNCRICENSAADFEMENLTNIFEFLR